MASAIIKWTDDEVKKVALQLHLNRPALNLLQAREIDDLVLLTKYDIADAMEKCLPIDRRRKFSSAYDAKPTLLKGFALLREQSQSDPAAAVAIPEPAPSPAPESPPDVEPPRRAKSGRPGFDAAELSKFPKIFWNKDEYDDLAGYLHRHYPALTKDDVAAKKIARRHVIEAMNKVLPEHRRRAMRHLSDGTRAGLEAAIKRMNLARAEKARLKQQEKERAEAEAIEAERQKAETIREIESRLSDEMGLPAEPEPVSEPEAIVIDQEAAPGEPAPVIEPEYVPPALPSLDELTAQFAAHLADRFALAFVDALIPRMKTAFSAHLAGALADIVTSPKPSPALTPTPTIIPKHNPAPAPSDTPRLPKVCIVGLLKSNHVQEVKEAFSKKYDLRFYHPDEAIQAMKDRSRNADKTILLTEQISHKHRWALEAERIPFVPMTGSIGRLKEFLNTLDVYA